MVTRWRASGPSVTVREDLGSWWVNVPARAACIEDMRQWSSDVEMFVELAVMGYEPVPDSHRHAGEYARIFDLKEAS